MKLNLETTNPAEERIKEYLEQNASEILAEKINEGVPIVKDGKTLINKKTLSGFMKYASGEARKLAEKGATSACVEDSVVYGWAIHYFEEESIEEKLYNQDGTEHKTQVKPTTKPVAAPVVAKPQPKPQMSLFDLIPKDDNTNTEETVDDDDEPTEEEIQEAMQEIVEEQQESVTPAPVVSPIYKRYMEVQAKYPDTIIAYRLGDFYEIFGENAIKVADELELTLTGRDCGLPERVPMVGYPYHVAKDYEQKIIEKGFTLAIVENQDEIRNLTPTLDEIVDDDLSEEEMREFDGDIDDEKHWIDDKTFVDNDGLVHNLEDDDLQKEIEFAKAFNKEALVVLDGIFGNLLTLR